MPIVLLCLRAVPSCQLACELTACLHPPADLKSVHYLEADLEPKVQVAARMLWAAVDVLSNEHQGYSAFLASIVRDYPSVLARLDPSIVQYFIHLSAGIPPTSPSLVVFVWDEVNVVASTRDGTATFFQEQLSEVVSSRRAAMEGKAVVDVMLVPVTASTRGSALNLSPTPSKKAGFTDLRLPLIKNTDDLALMVVDFMRRLHLPNQSDTIGTQPILHEQLRPLRAMPVEVWDRTPYLTCTQAMRLMSREQAWKLVSLIGGIAPCVHNMLCTTWDSPPLGGYT